MTKIPQHNLMIDLETTSLDPWSGRVTSAGIVAFDQNFQELDCLCTALSYPWNITHHFQDDAQTKEWRIEHQIDAMEAEFPRTQFDDLFRKLREMCTPETFVWAKPTKFDIVFLERLARVAEVKVPWHYRNIIDMRSFCMGLDLPLEEISDIERNRVQFAGKPHNPVDDARHQVKVLQHCVQMRG